MRPSGLLRVSGKCHFPNMHNGRGKFTNAHVAFGALFGLVPLAGVAVIDPNTIETAVSGLFDVTYGTDTTIAKKQFPVGPTFREL